MESLTYDTVARIGMVSSLLIFIAMFLIVLFYVFFMTSRDRMDAAQRTALDLGSSDKKAGGRT